MYVGLKQSRGDGERCVTPARAAAKETNGSTVRPIVRIKKQPIRNPVIWCSLASQQLSYKKN